LIEAERDKDELGTELAGFRAAIASCAAIAAIASLRTGHKPKCGPLETRGESGSNSSGAGVHLSVQVQLRARNARCSSLAHIFDLRHPLDMLADPWMITGAIRVTLEDMSASPIELPLEEEIVFYGTCPNEKCSIGIALRLMAFGIQRVRPLLGGFDAWKRLGYPLEDASGKLLPRQPAEPNMNPRTPEELLPALSPHVSNGPHFGLQPVRKDAIAAIASCAAIAALNPASSVPSSSLSRSA